MLRGALPPRLLPQRHVRQHRRLGTNVGQAGLSQQHQRGAHTAIRQLGRQRHARVRVRQRLHGARLLSRWVRRCGRRGGSGRGGGEERGAWAPLHAALNAGIDTWWCRTEAMWPPRYPDDQRRNGVRQAGVHGGASPSGLLACPSAHTCRATPRRPHHRRRHRALTVTVLARCTRGGFRESTLAARPCADPSLPSRWRHAQSCAHGGTIH
jgi:hypothetical protein